MLKTLRNFGFALAAYWVVATPAPAYAAASCDVPLPIIRTVGEAKVLIILDNSGSMNEGLYSDDYDDAVTYPGGLTTDQMYYVSADGNFTPRSFKGTLANTPTVHLVDSDQGEDGRYVGNYLNWIFFTATAAQRAAVPQVTRIQVAKGVVNNVIASNPNCEFGVEVFNGDNGGKLISTIGTPVGTMQTQVSGIDADSWTPLAESMVTALNYWQTTGASAPIKASCEKSFIILVTDGEPTMDLNVPAAYQGADAGNPGTCTSMGSRLPDNDDCSVYVRDVAGYMYTHDMRPDLTGNQNITTYVIGFNVDMGVLLDTANNGGGILYNAKNASQLGATLAEALSDIDKKVSAGSAVSVISAEDHTNNKLYRARFESVSWRGFVEAFQLPYDPNAAPLWEAGQILANRSAATRNIYTSTTGTNRMDFTVGNAAALQALLGAADVATATNYINYVRGTDQAGYRDRAGWKLGDIVDSSPVTIGKPASYYDFLSYPAFKAANLSRQEVLYVGANDGMLHCFSTADGSENWAYIPKNQLGKLSNLTDPSYCHNYFVNMTPAVYDINIAGTWKTVLIGGDERGGNGLFALDVTDPSAAGMKVLWDVDLPGAAGIKGSWTKPALVRDKTLNKFVLCASTGLDSITGTASVLVIDPANGSVLSTWNLGTAVSVNMGTTPSALDKNFDGFDDLMYVGDLGGRVWRFDLTGSPWTVTKLFDNTQPIQASPVLTMDTQGRVDIYFGTGKYVSGPDLYTTSSQTIYGLIDTGSLTALTRSSLVNQTSSFTALSGSDRGWFLDLTQYAGERVTKAAALIAGSLYVPSFRPKSGSCQAGGESWLYSLDFKDGSAPDKKDGSANNTTTGRVESMGDGILSNPAVDLVNADLILQNTNTAMISKDINANVQRLNVRSWRQKWN
jgi:type IV pilus assembly protein PilY1